MRMWWEAFTSALCELIIVVKGIFLCVALPLQEQNHCDTNGFKQEVKCVVKANNGTHRNHHYVTFKACPHEPSDFTNFLRFQVCF